MNMRVTKATSRWSASWPARGQTKRRRREGGNAVLRASIVTAAALALAGMSSSATGQAQGRPENWHQWGGPQRNFNVQSAPIARTWPANGPRQLWRRALGEGYSSILVDEST